MSKNHRYYQPLILNPTKKGDAQHLNRLLSTAKFVVDEIEGQLQEIIQIRHPEAIFKKFTKSQILRFKKELHKGSSSKLFGYWVYYPWNDYLVHFLPENLHTEIRTSRNRNLISTNEQEIYYRSTVAIAGLSVGNSSMATLLYTGGPKNIRLADHDILSASNLNRIRTSFLKLGQKKSDIAAQEIYEVNPYSNIKLFRNGLNSNNLRDFLLKPFPVDVLIEEMDNLFLKIQIRLLARKHRIPVIMAADNGDNVVLDIERFDQEPNRPLLHGDIPEKELLRITPNTPKTEAARIISRWVHPENVVPRMQSSLLELGKTLYTWPQLGSAAFLAGCALAYSARKIILKEPIKQGKFIISLDTILNPDYENKEFISRKQKLTKKFNKALLLEL